MLEDLNKEMLQYIKDIENKVKDPELLDYLLNRTQKLFDAVFKELNKISDYEEEKLAQLQLKQEKQEQIVKEQQNRLNELSTRIKDICADIYDEEGNFEIICPYCNHVFDANIDENTKEITCPECNNIIELDWSGESNDSDLS